MSRASVDGLGVIVAAPLGVVAGDVLIAYVAFDKGSDVTVIQPAGWTLVRRTDNGHQIGLAIYLNVAGAAEPPSYSWSFSKQTEAAVGLLAFSGVDAANPLDGEAGHETANDTAHSTPSITTTGAGLRIVSAHGVRKATTWTPPAGMTERFDVAASGNITLAGSDATQAAPGPTGALTAVAADQQQGLTHVLALRQAAAASSQ